MRPLILQWHITNRCNKRCAHCYQECYENKEFTTKELLNIAKQYVELLREYNKLEGHSLKGQINITGGEPFIREDIFEILDFFKEHKKEFTFGILTNGSLLTEDIVKKLKGYSPKMIQISLDGDEKMHDEIRGSGSFKEVENALSLLNKYDIKSLVSFTAHNKNYKVFPEVVKVGRKFKAYKVWTDRLVPIGSGDSGEVKTLTPKEVVEYVNILRKERKKLSNKFSKTKIGIERSLQFLCGEGDCYNCSAGEGLIIILENGDVLPCRRLPIVAGNLKDSSLKEIYLNSKVMKELREFKSEPLGCEGCSFFQICKGGAKCISYGVYGDYKVGDYGCPLKNKKVSK
ncbi:MAG: radical SAM protein [Clostridium sp.]